MSDFYTQEWDLGEAQARRRREKERRQFELNLGDIARQAQESMLDVNRQYKSGFEPRVTGYARRGLGRSGLFRRAMAQYASENQRSLGDIARSAAERSSGVRLQEQASAQGLQDYLDELSRQKAQKIWDEAALLKSWAPFTGLYS